MHRWVQRILFRADAILIAFFAGSRLLQFTKPVFAPSHTPFAMAIAGGTQLAPALGTASERSLETRN
jgi:hypothetical protein